MTIILTCANSITCLQTTTGFDFLNCIQTQCEFHSNVSAQCTSCLGDLGSGASAQSKLETCGGLRNVSNDTDTSCQYLFGGQTDNLLLSKYPIVANDTLYYSISPFTVWSVTWAKINTTSQGKTQLQNPRFNTKKGLVDVFCTHVVASQPFIDLSQENLNETAELLQFVSNKTANSSNPVFIMGDFNSVSQQKSNTKKKISPVKFFQVNKKKKSNIFFSKILKSQQKSNLTKIKIYIYFF